MNRENENPIDKIFDEVIEQQRSSDIEQRLHGRPIPTKQPKVEEKTRLDWLNNHLCSFI